MPLLNVIFIFRPSYDTSTFALIVSMVANINCM